MKKLEPLVSRKRLNKVVILMTDNEKMTLEKVSIEFKRTQADTIRYLITCAHEQQVRVATMNNSRQPQAVVGV